ncbi:thymidine kinase [Amylibacter kogurei]|uniref:Thymidine kinase n=1 Tax=Paramylibacter kogurei TaxID=1889778 RepID=A0A2G5KAF1_9RHOB|nr:thymidine kinase [Amylibacter kogurei]
MVKVVTLFLIFVAVLAIFGKLRLPQLPKPLQRRKVATAQKCKTCGTYLFKGIDCACQKQQKSEKD